MAKKCSTCTMSCSYLPLRIFYNRQKLVLYFVLYLSISIALLTACAFQKRFRPQTLSVGVYMPKRYRQLQVKDLAKVPAWRLEGDSNPRPPGKKAWPLPMRHHAPQCNIT